MPGQGGVHNTGTHREETAGESLRERIMEVALEQRTERCGFPHPCRLRRFPPLPGRGIAQGCTG